MTNKILFLTAFLFIACGSSDKLHTAQYKGSEILVGKAQRSDFEHKPYNEWFDANYRDYRPDATVVAALKPVINNFKLVILMGTWCGDSQEQVPVLFKVLDAANYNKKPLIYCVPRQYKYYKPAKTYKIIRVPTIIVYKNGQEKGRIIEYPMKNIESDLLKIMTTNNYRHELNDYTK